MEIQASKEKKEPPAQKDSVDFRVLLGLWVALVRQGKRVMLDH